MRPEVVIARRRAERDGLLRRAGAFAAALDEGLEVSGVVVYGSVARGDFNLWSDIDVLVVADRLPDRLLDRFDRLPPPPPGVQAIAWTPREWAHRRARRDPIAVEAVERGVWLVGAPDQLQ